MVSTLSDMANEHVSPHEFAEHVASFLTDGDTSDADTAEAPDVETQETVTDTAEGRARDPETGRFTKTEQEEQVEEEEEQPEGEELPEGEYDLILDDPEVEAFLGKYNGDIGEALRAATEAQKLIGRKEVQGEGYQQMQAELQELKSMLLQQNAPRPDAHINWAQRIEDDPRAAAMDAQRVGNVDAMVAAVKEWAQSGDSYDAFEAATFLNGVQRGAEMMQLREEMAQQATRAPQATSTDDAEAAKVLQKHPDLEAFLPAIAQVAQERPLLRNVLENGAPSEKASALEDLYLIARSRSSASDTSEALKRIRVKTSAESAQAKADAAVVSASRGSAASGTPPTRAESFLDAFDEHLRGRGLIGSDES